MSNLDQIKQELCKAIDSQREKLIALGEDIFAHPELGYKEYRTSRQIREALEQFGATEIESTATTGLKSWLRTANPVASVAILGELDAVISPQHPFADKETGAAHACGHHAQLVTMLGALLGLSAVRQHLDGDVCFMAVPAEEYVEIGYREELLHQGEIQYLGGKQQMIAEGAFEDIDMALMVHGQTATNPQVSTRATGSGFVGKTVQFLGKEAHAGGQPWEGVNALNAAALAIQAIHAQRETFPDTDSIRVHPIITKGGDLVNTVPADVQMESYVRAASIPAIQSANEKVNRAIRGASYAIGAEEIIHDLPGYLPLEQNKSLSILFEENTLLLGQNITITRGGFSGGSTDMGDLAWYLPAIQPSVSGFSGSGHSKDFMVSDPELAYIVPAKIMAMTTVDLLYNHAERAVSIRESFQRKTPEEFTALWQNILGNN